MQLTLYHYWRSSASWRVRWAFHLKKIPCEFAAVDLLKGEQKSEAHLKRNPLGTVPVLEIEENGKKRYLGESLAIIEWAEEISPTPSLLPGDAWQRGRIRQLAEVINSGTMPVSNLKVRKFYSSDEEKAKAWSQHWVRQGLTAYEKLVQETAGKFSVGNQITLADLCLIPQCASAKRFEIPLEEFPTVARIYTAALATESCQASSPEKFGP